MQPLCVGNVAATSGQDEYPGACGECTTGGRAPHPLHHLLMHREISPDSICQHTRQHHLHLNKHPTSIKLFASSLKPGKNSICCGHISLLKVAVKATRTDQIDALTTNLESRPNPQSTVYLPQKNVTVLRIVTEKFYQ